MTNELPDEGTGEEIVFANLNWQSYVTEMNSSMAAKIATYAIVQFVIPDVDLDDTDFSIKLPSYDDPVHHLGKRAISETLVSIPNSKFHQKVTSQRKASNIAFTLNDYLYDPIAGAGCTIYVIDAGIQFGHAEFQGVNIIEQAYAPKRLMSDRDGQAGLDIMQDMRNHGTGVCGIAVGNTCGIARKANLVPVKYKNYNQARPGALIWCLPWITSNVIANNRQRKSVINISFGKSKPHALLLDSYCFRHAQNTNVIT